MSGMTGNKLKYFHFFLIFFISAFTVFRSYAQKLREGFISMKDNTRIYFRAYGAKGDTLVFLHGGPGQNMYGVGPDLLPLAGSFVLIMYDQRGCGNSETGDTAILSADRHVEDLEEIRKYFSIKKMMLIGHSWGAMLAAMYTAKYTGSVTRLLFL